MAKNYDEQKVYSELDKIDSMYELTMAIEGVKLFASKKIAQEIKDEKERIIINEELIQKINGN